MRKEFPRGLSREGLFGPRPDYDYFDGAARFPLRDVATFAPTNAWWLAEASLLAYVKEPDRVRAVLARAGFRDVFFFSRNSTHCFLAEGPVRMVAFRGTETGDLEDYKTDLRFLLKPSPTRGHAHQGFLEALDLVWDDLRRALGDEPCWFTGHSLGGALATLAAARHPRSGPLYTFGSPRVGDEAFGATLSAPAYRIVNHNDLIVELPPPVKYRHVGELYYFDEKGALHRDPPLSTQLKARLRGRGSRLAEAASAWLKGDLKAIPSDSVVDHSPLHYAILCWNHLLEAKRR